MPVDELVRHVASGGLAVMPTDTVLGIVASALQPEAVQRIYTLKGRPTDKPPVLLIADAAEVAQFGTTVAAEKTEQFWPGPNSLILPVPDVSFNYLHRGRGSLAFRVPQPLWLRQLLEQTGPLATSSANLSGQPILTSLEEASRQFADQGILFWQPDPPFTITGQPSQLMALQADDSWQKLSR